MRFRVGAARAMAVVLVAASVPVVVAQGVAVAGGPSTELPVVSPVPATKDLTTTRPVDEASAKALHDDQGNRTVGDGAGTYTATPLTPSATWQVSAQMGDFSWSYPLRVPPAAGGFEPELALSYRSSAVDGRTSATNQQASWLGDGWDLSAGFVERSYGSCLDDTDGTTPPKVGDLCWRSDNATASFPGGGGTLVCCDGDGRWRTEHDNGERIERLDGKANGDDNGESWKVTTADGTQYFFGSEQDAKSTWTVPVFGDDKGEPCNVVGSFDTSHCNQAWRWNLDKVIDRNGNVIRYFYDTETNSYGLNMKDTAVSYVRGGLLRRVEYGLHTGFANTATGRVLFEPANRCVPGGGCATDKPANWPDVPWDDKCDTATCKDKHSPTFWSTRRLSTVTTDVWHDGRYQPVDRWTLDQQYPEPGDGEKPALWLKSIKHTGLFGGSLDMPLVTFEGSQLANRVASPSDGYAKLNRYRVTGVVSETGGWVSVNYAKPDCAAGNTPAKPETNTMRCFPQRWTKKDHAERTDYFHKYVVASVVRSDQMSSSTQQETRYDYLDGAAWHWNKSELAKDDKKTWDEFRGFGRVRVRTGAENDPAGPVTMTEQRFYRGMDGDRLPNNGTKRATVSDSENGTRTDSEWLTGFPLETTTFDGVNGPAVAKTIMEPVWQGPTATRGSYQAYLVGTGTQREYTALGSGGWRVTRTVTGYDDRGQAVSVNDLGGDGTADDRCTKTSYARNTAKWLLALPATVETVAGDCALVPVFPRDAIADTVNSYDGNGNLTGTKVAAERPSTAPVYVTGKTFTYDKHGRTRTETDALGNTTTTAYTPAQGGPLTSVTVTAPPALPGRAAMATTTALTPAWGEPTTVTDANGRVTERAYDALGRRTEVWLGNRYRSEGDPGNYQYSYQLRRDRLSVVTTSTLGPNGRYTTVNSLYDGFLRLRQTQKAVPGGGRLLTDTRYDSQGRPYKTSQPFFNSGAVDDVLWVASDTEIPGSTRTRYDGAGRAVASVYQAGATDKWSTTTAYHGDRVDVTPPKGGTATTTITDARGRTVELRQYRGATPAGDYDSTRYRYTTADQLAELTGPDGATWRYGYDLLGRTTSSTDPDKGTSTMGYDSVDRLVWTRDALGVTTAVDYDALGRKTALHKDSATGPLLAQWGYDTAGSGKGYLASATRFHDGLAYTSTVDSYTALYKPLKQSVTIPAEEDELAGTYTWSGGYGADGTLTGESYPAAGDLATETVNHGFDDDGRATTTTGFFKGGNVPLVGASSYTRYGELERLELGAGAKRAWLSSYYDTSTRRLERSIVDAEVPAPMLADTRYATDPAGNITSVTDAVVDRPADTQCFRYDHVRRLTEVWTPTGDCAAAPAATKLGGPAPYWHSYTYDLGGNRRTETFHGTAGNAVRTYGYPAAGQPQPHTLRSVTGDGATTTYGYDGAGNTVSRTTGGVQETLAWDVEGRMASSTKAGATTSFVYTADGVRLLRKDPLGTTLYLGNQEVRLSASGGPATTTRYYTHGDKTIAMRKGSTLTWLANDHQNTAQIAIDATTQTVTTRRQLPFGGPRGATADWPGEKGFVGGTKDPSTGLTHLGAREYDPATGRFISDDPIVDQDNPQQLNGYAYADNSPVTSSDPSGLIGQTWDGFDYVPPTRPAPIQQRICCDAPRQPTTSFQEAIRRLRLPAVNVKATMNAVAFIRPPKPPPPWRRCDGGNTRSCARNAMSIAESLYDDAIQELKDRKDPQARPKAVTNWVCGSAMAAFFLGAGGEACIGTNRYGTMVSVTGKYGVGGGVSAGLGFKTSLEDAPGGGWNTGSTAFASVGPIEFDSSSVSGELRGVKPNVKINAKMPVGVLAGRSHSASTYIYEVGSKFDKISPEQVIHDANATYAQLEREFIPRKLPG